MLLNSDIQLIECPRDAMQGWNRIFPTSEKVDYLQQLLKVGFHTLDCGSFVSAKAVPQMADTAEVLKQLDLSETQTKLLVIVANERGAETAMNFNNVNYIGYPFSVSPTFQRRNTNSSMDESLKLVNKLKELCEANEKELVVYLSMGFGNPYGDEYSVAWVLKWANSLANIGINIISIADTVGLANPEAVKELSAILINAFPLKNMGVHLHSQPQQATAKLQASWQAGIRRFEGTLKGIGGCPFANDDLVGNMDTETMIGFFEQHYLLPGLDHHALDKASAMAARIFT